MRNSIKILFLLFASMLLPNASGQVAPVTNGSTVIIQTSVAQQAGNAPITFQPKGSYTYKVSIKENGDREFVRPDGFVNHAYDGVFTNITWRNKQIPPEWRFIRFPQGAVLQAGMKWKVPPWKMKTDCQPMYVNYTATSENGPDVNLTIDGKDVRIKTIQINYEAPMPGCGPWSWRMTHEELYAPELNELISSKAIGWDSRNPKLFLSEGSGWAITAIQTVGKQESK